MDTGHVHVVQTHIEHLGNDLGMWCNDCNLPSGVRIWYVATCLGTSVLRQILACVDCDGDNVTEP